jgi:hypothetical protein
MTICTQWAWKPDDPLKSLDQCLHSLIRTNDGAVTLRVRFPTQREFGADAHAREFQDAAFEDGENERTGRFEY